MISSQITRQISDSYASIADFLIRNKDKVAPAAVTTASGGIIGVQTAADIRQVEGKEDKRNTVVNNLIIGAAMIAGGLLSHRYAKKFLADYEPGKLFRSINERLPVALRDYPRKDFFEALSIPVGAGIAGGIAGEVAQRAFPVDDVKYDVMERAGIISNIDYDAINKVYEIDAMNATKSMDGIFSTIVGYSVGREKGIKNKVKKFVFELVSGIIVPLAVILPLTGYLNKILPNDAEKLSRTLNRGILGRLSPDKLLSYTKRAKAGIILGAGIGLAIAGKGIAQWVDREITENIVENKLWEELSKKQKELLKLSVLTHNPFAKKEVTEEIGKIKEAKERIKGNKSVL